MKLCTIFHTLILGSVLFLGSLASSQAAEMPTPADFIIRNAKIITVNSNSPLAQAIAVRGNQIVAVGKDRQIERYKGADTRVIDAHGNTVLPGLADSDVDSYLAATSELNQSSPILTSLAAAFQYIRDQAAQKPAETWIVVTGVYPTRVKEGRLPTKEELDAAAPKHPVYWGCGTLAMVNSKALQLSKITTDSTNPPGGEIVLDPDTRQPTGLLRNAAGLLKLPVVPLPTAKQTRASLKHLYQLYNQQGITSISESHAEPAAIDLFRDLSKSNELTVRITCTRPIDPAATIEENLARLNSVTNAPAGKLPYGPTGVGDDWVRIGALKAKLDGDLRTGTAYLRTPWSIGPTYGISEPAYRGDFVEDPDVLPALFLQAAQRGWQLSADCTGDACLDQLLNCYQSVQFKLDIRQRRFLVNHATFQAEQNWEKFRNLGIAASMQPAWLYRDGDSLEKTLGDHRLRHFLPFKSSLDHGLIIGAGSDHVAQTGSFTATNPWNPWLGLWIMVARQTDSGAEIYPEEKLSREQAIRCYTLNNAWLNFAEQKQGSLEAGKLADLIIVDQDLLKCPVDNLRNTKVQLTMLDGKVVWEAK